jgi:hypothetical protein
MVASDTGDSKRAALEDETEKRMAAQAQVGKLEDTRRRMMTIGTEAFAENDRAPQASVRRQRQCHAGQACAGGAVRWLDRG